MDTASCRMAPQIWLMNDISPITRFVPMFMTIATPMTMRKMTGSNHECEVRPRITMTMSTATSMMKTISVAVELCALAVFTASPASDTCDAPVPSAVARASSSAATALPGSTTSWNT